MSSQSSSRYAWTISTANDLLAKAKRDLKRFQTSHEYGDGEQVDHAVNCAITLWHVHDWVWRERSAEWAARGIVDKGSFQNWLHSRDGRGRLSLCERIANGSKHLVLDKPVDNDLTTAVMEFDVPDSMMREIRIRHEKGERFVAYSIGVGETRDVLVLITTQDRLIRVDNLLTATIEFWDQFLGAG